MTLTMANLLILNQPYVSVGLTTSTFTFPVAGLYSLRFSATLPSAVSTGDGGGSGQGLGSGRGGGDLYGFSKGGGGLGQGAVGQGFGADNSGYQQPPAVGSNATSGPVVQSGLVVTVNQNGSPIYTSPTIANLQSHFEFSLNMNCALNDTLSVVLSSANAADATLEAVKSTCAVNQGLKQ